MTKRKIFVLGGSFLILIALVIGIFSNPLTGGAVDEEVYEEVPEDFIFYCESEDGDDPEVKGNATWNTWETDGRGERVKTAKDYCGRYVGVKSGDCITAESAEIGQRCLVVESYCDGNSMKTKMVDCSYACENGACVDAPGEETTTTSNETATDTTTTSNETTTTVQEVENETIIEPTIQNETTTIYQEEETEEYEKPQEIAPEKEKLETTPTSIQSFEAKGKLYENQIKADLSESQVIGNKFKADSEPEIVISQGKIYVLTEDKEEISLVEIKFSPDKIIEATEKIETKRSSLSKMKIIEKDENIVYEVEYTKNAKILGLIKTKISTTYEITVDTGKTLNIKKPWWEFLAF